MFMFYWPWMSLLLPLPLIARVLLSACKETDTVPTLYFPALRRLKQAFPFERKAHKHSDYRTLIILFLLWTSLVFAVMRPQWVQKFTAVQTQGYDLMLAVDISESMQALDFSTKKETISRLDVAKDVVGKFVNERQGDRVGLILFGQHAYLQVPLTLDTLSVSQMLDNAVPGMAGPLTAIGDAIGLAVRNLRDRPEGSRVIILLTDGEDTASSIPPLEAAKLAQHYGIRIYTIGVGKNGLVPYPDGRGGIIMGEAPLDEQLLREIASFTQGQYFRATDSQALQTIYSKINELEKTKANVRHYLIREPLHHYPLGMAGILLLLFCLMPLFRRALHEV